MSWKPGRAGVIGSFVLFQVVCGAAFAQSAETQAVAPPPAAEAANDSGPFGGCEPIGMTASGELVFPLECKHKIKLPSAPVASEEQVRAAPPAVAEAKPDDKLVATPAKAAAEDNPAAETKAAVVEDKPAAAAAVPAAAEAKPVAAPETLTATDKAPAAAEQKPVAAKPAAQAGATVTSEKPARRADRRAGKIASVAKQIVATAKPAKGNAALAHASAQVQAASLPACTHYRSYDAASQSYRGFDGHMHACH
jgi:hypothetical protein